MWFYQRVDLLHFGHCPYLGANSVVEQTLNIRVQTFCIIGCGKDCRIRTFPVIQH